MKGNSKIKYVIAVIITIILTCFILYLIKSNSPIYKTANNTIKILKKYNSNLTNTEETIKNLQIIYNGFNSKYHKGKNEYNALYIHFVNDLYNIINYLELNNSDKNVDKNIINESIEYMTSYQTFF